jgi:hypothetical protein
MGYRVYIVLSRTHTLMAKAIRIRVGGYYNHASLSLSKELKPLYSFGRKKSKLPLPAGFISEMENGMYMTRHPELDICVLEMRVNKEEYKKIEQKLQTFTEKPSRYGYNIAALPLVCFNIPFQREKHYTCSGFVATVLNDGLNFKKDCSLVRPEDFLKFGFQRVYEGPIGQYAKIS